jgi:hypothetical protein
MLVPATDRRGLGSAQGTPELCPSTSVAETPSPLLAVMFPTEDVCQRSLQDLAAEGFGRNRLPAVLKRLVEAGFLSRHRVARFPNTYRLHLPPMEQS